MNSRSDANKASVRGRPDNGSCWSDAALEERAVAHLRTDLSSAPEEHLQTCASCAARFQRVGEEVKAIRAALLGMSGQAGGDCPDEETLALYLDRALAKTDQSAVEAHLASCRRCQGALAAMYRELTVVADPDAHLGLPDAAKRPSADGRFAAQERKSTQTTAPKKAEQTEAEASPCEQEEEKGEKRKGRYL